MKTNNYHWIEIITWIITIRKNYLKPYIALSTGAVE